MTYKIDFMFLLTLLKLVMKRVKNAKALTVCGGLAWYLGNWQSTFLSIL